MRRFVSILIFLTLCHARADVALQAFTNQANSLLQAQFGFGITNIPIYSPTNAAVRYNAAIHYDLQAAADLYDATTPATNYPSVFRPLFAWEGGELFIVGYTNVTTDFDAQLARGFKDVSDPTIGTNDNVWGVPWVVGAKNNAPQFNEFDNNNVLSMTRKLQFVRPNQSRPTFLLTNQMYIFAISNFAGVEAWNNTGQMLAGPFEMVVSNKMLLLFTNNYDWGTNIEADMGTNLEVQQWAGLPAPYWAAYVAPHLFASVSVPFSEWVESPPKLKSAFGNFETNLPGLPTHDWELRVTNHLVYSLSDLSSGTNRLLDFVNLSMGGSLDPNEAIANLPTPTNSVPMSYSKAWDTNGASDVANAASAKGLINQIEIGEGLLQVSDWTAQATFTSSNLFAAEQQVFYNFLRGGGTTNSLMGCPFQPTTVFAQVTDYAASNPKVHYAIDDLDSESNAVTIFNPSYNPRFIPSGTLGRQNASYQSSEPFAPQFVVSNNVLQFSFRGANDLPYLIWTSTNLVDWQATAAARQVSPGQFEFDDPLTNGSARFYQVRAP